MTEKLQIQISADIESVVSPLQLQTGSQRLIKRISLPLSDMPAGEPPRMWVRLPELVDAPWLLGSGAPAELYCNQAVIVPRNPPIVVGSQLASSRTEIRSTLELTIDHVGRWAWEVLILPPVAIPTDFEQATALAALVDPMAPMIDRILEASLRGVEGSDVRRGFTPLGPIDAAKHIFNALSQWPKLTMAKDKGIVRKHQIVRTPTEVLVHGDATCVDIAVLFAATCERIRLSPVLLGIKTDTNVWHAVPGIHTAEFSVGERPLLRDLDAIREICEPARIRLFDPTMAFGRATAKAADEMARRGLAQAHDAFLVDIVAARKAGIWSLPIGSQQSESPFGRAAPVLPRRDRVSTRASMSHLEQELAAGRVTLILGDTLDPDGPGSRQALIRELSGKLDCMDEHSDLLAIGAEFEKKHGRPRLEDCALAVFRRRRDQSLYKIIAGLPISTIVSFFPDGTLESALARATPPFRALIGNRDLTALRHRDAGREFYLLGGSARSGAELMLTYRDKENSRLRISKLGRGLRDRLAEDTLLLIGCDTNDPNLNELFDAATPHVRTGIRQIYICGGHAADIDGFPLGLSAPKLIQQLATWATAVPMKPPQAPVRHKVQPLAGRAPYKYLDSFNPEDEDLFFGRDDDVHNITREILASPSRLTVLCGRSGVGKTSLVKAGLFPALRGLHDYRPSYARPARDPLAAMKAALVIENAEYLDGQDFSKAPLHEVVAALYRAGAPEQVVFFDQVEEAFFSAAKLALATFLDTVLACTAQPDSLLRLVLIVREDYLAQLLSYGQESGGVLATVTRLAELSPKGALDAIVKPALACGLQVDADLASAILDDLSPDTFLPAHLQIVCERIYRERGAQSTLDMALYERIGRAGQILDNHMTAQLEQLQPSFRDLAQTVLKQLITSERTRAVHTLEEIVRGACLPLATTEGVLNELIHTCRLVNVLPGHLKTYELTHELLAEAVFRWCDETDARTRQIEEMLDQEVAIARLQDDFIFPEDKLRLVDENRESLNLSPDAVLIVCQALWRKGTLPAFWLAKFADLCFEYRCQLVLGFAASAYDTAVFQKLKTLPKPSIALLPSGPFSPSLIDAILTHAARGKCGAFPGWIGTLGELDASRRLLQYLFDHFDTLPSRVRVDFVQWISSKREWSSADLQLVGSLGDDQEAIASICQALLRRGPLSDLWMEQFRCLDAGYRRLVVLGTRRDDYCEDDFDALIKMDAPLLALLLPEPFDDELLDRVVKHTLSGDSLNLRQISRLLALDSSGRLATRLVRIYDGLGTKARVALRRWLPTNTHPNSFERDARRRAARIVAQVRGLPPDWRKYIDSLSGAERIYVALGQWVSSLDEVSLPYILDQGAQALMRLPAIEYSFELAELVAEHIIEAAGKPPHAGISLLMRDCSGRSFHELAQRIHHLAPELRRAILVLIAKHACGSSEWAVPLRRLVPGIRVMFQHHHLHQYIRTLLSAFPGQERATAVKDLWSLDYLVESSEAEQFVDFVVFLSPVFNADDDIEALRGTAAQGDAQQIRRALRIAVAGPSDAALAAMLDDLGYLPDGAANCVLATWRELGELGHRALANAVNGNPPLSWRVLLRMLAFPWPGVLPVLIAHAGRVVDAGIECRLAATISDLVGRYGPSEAALQQFEAELPRLTRIDYPHLPALQRSLGNAAGPDGWGKASIRPIVLADAGSGGAQYEGQT